MIKRLFCILTAVLVLAQVPALAQSELYDPIVQDVKIEKTMTQEDGNATVTATAEISPTWASGEKMALCLVAYADSLVTSMEKKEFIAGQDEEISVSITVQPNVTCKAFVWTGDMTPAFESAEIQVWDSFMVNSKQVYDEDRDYMVAPEDVFDLTGEKKIFSYWNDRETDSHISTVEIDPEAIVTWNGNEPIFLKSTDMQKEDVVPPRGTVTLSDRNRDGLYDLFEISAYDVALVHEVDLESNTILLKPYRSVAMIEETEIKLPPDAELYSITLDGREIGIEALRENDVLNIYMKDWLAPDEFSIVVTRDYIDGVVELVDYAKESFIVNGLELCLTEDMLNIQLPELDVNARLFMDQEGNTCYIDYDYLTDNSGYFYKTAQGTFEDEYLYLLTEDGEWKNYNASNQIKINGVSKADLDTPYTKSNVNDIFQRDIFAESTEPAPANGIFEGAGSELLTPRLFLEYMIDYAFLPSVSPTGSAEADRLIGYRVIYGMIESITLPGVDFAGEMSALRGEKVENAVWQGNMMYFQTEDGPVQVQEDAAVFFIGEGKPQQAYAVRSVYELEKDKSYTAYLYWNGGEAVQTILLLEGIDWIAPYEPLCIFDSYTLARLNGKDVMNVTYWESGNKQEEPLTVSEPAFEAVKGMERGDVFIYGLNSSGLVNIIEVIFRPGKEPIPFYTDFDQYVDISGVEEHFQLAGQDGDKENEVYFGYVGKVVDIKGGKRVVLVDETGEFTFSSSQDFIVPDVANIYYYNPSLMKERQIQRASVSIISPSFYTQDNLGNIDFENTDLNFMRYAFVRTYKGKVTDIIYVRYTQ